MKKYILISGLMLLGAASMAQVKIGDNPTTIGASSLLELESTEKALLLPRVADTTAIANPVDGMMIYDISTKSVRVFQRNGWAKLFASLEHAPAMDFYIRPEFVLERKRQLATIV